MFSNIFAFFSIDNRNVLGRHCFVSSHGGLRFPGAYGERFQSYNKVVQKKKRQSKHLQGQRPSNYHDLERLFY